jgi:hypothetical protein
MAGQDLTDEQARWLAKLLLSRPRNGEVDNLSMPDDVHDVLAAKGFLQWKKGAMEITLDGIKEVASRRRSLQEMTSVELNGDEKLWLSALSRGPFKPSAARHMSEKVRDSLIAKGLIRWKVGFLEITPKGATAATSMKTAQNAV